MTTMNLPTRLPRQFPPEEYYWTTYLPTRMLKGVADVTRQVGGDHRLWLNESGSSLKLQTSNIVDMKQAIDCLLYND